MRPRAQDKMLLTFRELIDAIRELNKERYSGAVATHLRAAEKLLQEIIQQEIDRNAPPLKGAA